MNETIYEAGNAALPEGFLALPPLVYADEPMWIPESPEAVAAAFVAEKGRLRLALTSPLAASRPGGRAGFHRLRGGRSPG